MSRKTLTYKGMMLAGVPNFALTIGYTNASWTLKADLVAAVRRAACCEHMDRHGLRQRHAATPRPTCAAGELAPLIDLQAGLRAAQRRRAAEAGRARRRGGCTRTTSATSACCVPADSPTTCGSDAAARSFPGVR